MNEEIKNVVTRLRQGEIILYPTDAGWCLGCDATNESAVKRIQNLVSVPDSDRAVLVDSTAKLQGYFSDVPDLAYDLIDMSEKPLILVLSHAKNMAMRLLGDDGSVGVRITNEIFSKRVCEMFRRPVVAFPASAEPFTRSIVFDMILPDIIAGVDYVAQYRQDDLAKVSLPSVIKLSSGGLIKVVRE